MEYKVRIKRNEYLVSKLIQCKGLISSDVTEVRVTSNTTDVNEVYRLAYKQYAVQNGLDETELNNKPHGFDNDGQMWIGFPVQDHQQIILCAEILNENAPTIHKVRIEKVEHYIYDFRNNICSSTLSSNVAEVSVASNSTDAHEIYRLAYKKYATRNGFIETELNKKPHGFNDSGTMWIGFPAYNHRQIILYATILDENTSPNPQ